MAYYDNPGQINDEAISIAGGKTFQVIQLADSEGNIINPASGQIVLEGDVVVGTEIEISNDSGNPIPTVTGFSIPEHDNVSLSYTDSKLTGAVYTKGGVTVGTLTLTYDVDNNLINVARS